MPTPPRLTQPTLLLSSIAIAVLTLMNQASARQGDGGMTRIEVTGSSIKRLASENALPLTTIKADDLVIRGRQQANHPADQGQPAVLTGATPDLEPEKSKTFTAGIVIEPVKNLVASLDFWNVEMTGTIAQIAKDTIFGDVHKYNNLFVRNADGTLAYITKTRLNMGGLRTQGIDASLNYTLPTASMGRFGMSFDGTDVNKYEGQNEEGGDWIDSVGEPGALSTGATSANTYLFKWKHNLRLSWSRGGFGTQLTQSYTSRYIDTNALPSQKPGQPFYNEIAPYILYNRSANYAWSKRLKFTFGVNNLLDVDPPLSNQRLGSRVVFAQNIAKPIGRAYNVRMNYTF